MIPIKQVGDSCLLAAAASVDPSIDYEVLLPEYEQAVLSKGLAEPEIWQAGVEFFRRHAPWLQMDKVREGTKTTYIGREAYDFVPDLSDSGVLGIVLLRGHDEIEAVGRHAIAYEAGWIFDPDTGLSVPDFGIYRVLRRIQFDEFAIIEEVLHRDGRVTFQPKPRRKLQCTSMTP